MADPRRKLRPVPLAQRPDQPTPIDAAIDAVADRQVKAVAQIPVLTEPHAWDGQQEVRIGAMPSGPTLLIFEAASGAWRPVVLPPGSTWRVVPDKPAFWVPR